MIPQVQYTTSGSVNIAYQVFGQEAPNLVIVLGWLSNVEESWKNPWMVNWLNSLASFSRVVIFDKRGTGLSDRLPVDHLPGFDQRMDDLRAVMDAADCKDAFIFGVSEGGPLATAFSVTYPERCRGLIIFNSYAKWIRDKDHPYGWTREQHEKSLNLIQANWGQPVGLKLFAPSVADDPLMQQAWASYMRQSASPGSALALYRMNLEIDVRDILHLVKVPTLVLHRKNDRLIEPAQGKYIAGNIPKAKFVELPGADHLAWFGDAEPVVEAMKNFVTNAPRERKVEGSLNAVAILEMQIELPELEKSIEDFGGLLVSKKPDKVVALFKGPGKALRWACTWQASQYGNSVAALVHVDDVDAKGKSRISSIVKSKGKFLQKGKVLATRSVKNLLIEPELKLEEFKSSKSGELYEVFMKGVAPQAGISLSNQDVAVFLKVREYLNEHFRETITLKELAKKFGLNEFKLKTGFKQLFQNTVGKYLDERKMKLACELLETTENSIQDIAFEVGYEHYNNFILAFKRRFNMTPLQYRKEKQLMLQTT